MFSKSNYTDGLQCPKMLWMERNMPEQRAEELVRSDLLASGDEVGALARKWAGEHELVEQVFDFEAMAFRTEDALARSKQNGNAVCEATFIAGGLLCMADIVRWLPGGKSLELVEVKASTKLKDYHLDDAAFQAHVIRSAGYPVGSVSILHLDPGYRLEGELDLDGMFLQEDVTAEVDERAADVVANTAAMVRVQEQEEEPEMGIGRHCNSPHACPYQGWCWRHVPEKSVFGLAGMGRLRGLKHYEDGAVGLDQMLAREREGKVKLNGLQKAQIAAETGKGDTVDKEAISSFLEKLSFPLHFLDFETVQPAVPAFEGTRCYQQIPTQFSLHWLDGPSGELHHAEYLAPAEGDPRRGVAEALVAAIPQGACTTAYNKSFECGRIREMAKAFPDLHNALMAIHDSIVDLMVPFQKGWAYKEAMGGSYSIKKVLPAICPDDQELDYGALEGVHNGSEAMEAFASLAGLPEAEQASLREQLLRYCELDTLAMVKVWEWLVRAAA